MKKPHAPPRNCHHLTKPFPKKKIALQNAESIKQIINILTR